MSWQLFLVRVVEALLLGAFIGSERQYHHRIAGLRTNALVAVGASLFVSIVGLVPGLANEGARVAAQVVSGIGFLGAGVIMREGLNVRGLNTAATLWCSSAVGVLSGLGLFAEAAIAAAVIVGANLTIPWLLERRVTSSLARPSGGTYRIRLRCAAGACAPVRTALLEGLQGREFFPHAVDSRVFENGSCEVAADLGLLSSDVPGLEAVVSGLQAMETVESVGWTLVEDNR
jgi:putative Mg2+ transporter-C (MgtC) family protein